MRGVGWKHFVQLGKNPRIVSGELLEQCERVLQCVVGRVVGEEQYEQQRGQQQDHQQEGFFLKQVVLLLAHRFAIEVAHHQEVLDGQCPVHCGQGGLPLQCLGRYD